MGSSSGPKNYTHGKTNKPIYLTESISYAIIFPDIKSTTLPKSKTLTASCNAKCKIRAVEVDKEKGIYLHKGFKWSTSLEGCDFATLANPNSSIENSMYISGKGRQSSMMYYDNDWWIVFAHINRKHNTCIVLHNVLLEPWDRSILDKLKNKIVSEFITGE